MNRSLFSALKLEKLTMFIILTMIVLVGALNIISTLVMVVMEKTRDVAILRAMGASARSIMSIFMFQGILVGIIGTLRRPFIGFGPLPVIVQVSVYQSSPPMFIIFPNCRFKCSASDVAMVAASAVVISFLATLYPAWYASRLNPVESFRYE